MQERHRWADIGAGADSSGGVECGSNLVAQQESLGIAMLMLSLLACAVLEPYLFADGITYYFYDFVFMMCLGYMNAWRTREGER